MTASQLLYQQINRSNDFMMTCNIKKIAITIILMVGKIKNMAVAIILVILVKIQDQELGACNNSTYGDLQH